MQQATEQPNSNKKRLTGVILLALMIAIAAPFVVRSPEQVRVALDLEIPPPPPLPSALDEVLVSDAELARVEQRLAKLTEVPKDTVAPEVPETLEAAPTTELVSPQLAKSFPEKAPQIAEGWGVQLASFSEQANAQALKQKLLDAGYPAYIRISNEPTLYRVYAGPELEREQALKLRGRLAEDQAIALTGLVMPYRLN